MEWEWPIVPAVLLSVVVLAPLLGLLLERLIFRHLRTALGARQAGRHHRPGGRHPEPLRPPRRLQGGRGRDARGRRRPTAPRSSTTRSACTRSAATSWSPWASRSSPRSALAALFTFTRDRPADAGGGRERADDRAQRHRRRPGVGLRVGAVVAVRRPGRRPDRAPVQHARRAATSSTSWSSPSPPPPVGRLVSLPRALAGGLGLGMLIAEVNTFLPALERRPAVAAARSRTTSPRRSRSSCSSACSSSCRASGGPATPATRWPASTRRRRRSGAIVRDPARV